MPNGGVRSSTILKKKGIENVSSAIDTEQSSSSGLKDSANRNVSKPKVTVAPDGSKTSVSTQIVPNPDGTYKVHEKRRHEGPVSFQILLKPTF
jgi:hypothetical protein